MELDRIESKKIFGPGRRSNGLKIDGPEKGHSSTKVNSIGFR